jgi:hypothetical protein
MVSLVNCNEMPPSVPEITAFDNRWRVLESTAATAN